jgi:hypothetical protein
VSSVEGKIRLIDDLPPDLVGPLPVVTSSVDDALNDSIDDPAHEPPDRTPREDVLAALRSSFDLALEEFVNSLRLMLGILDPTDGAVADTPHDGFAARFIGGDLTDQGNIVDTIA